MLLVYQLQRTDTNHVENVTVHIKGNLNLPDNMTVVQQAINVTLNTPSVCTYYLSCYDILD